MKVYWVEQEDVQVYSIGNHAGRVTKFLYYSGQMMEESLLIAGSFEYHSDLARYARKHGILSDEAFENNLVGAGDGGASVDQRYNGRLLGWGSVGFALPESRILQEVKDLLLKELGLKM